MPRYLASGRSGNHLPFGWFVATGPGIAAGRQLGTHDIVDLAPTVRQLPRSRAGSAFPRAAAAARVLSRAGHAAPMLIDARRDPPGSTLRCDVCIVGAGPAGITLARELDDGQREICLLECGGNPLEAATQSLAGCGAWKRRLSAAARRARRCARRLDAGLGRLVPTARRYRFRTQARDSVQRLANLAGRTGSFLCCKPTPRSGSDRSRTIPSRGSAHPAARRRNWLAMTYSQSSFESRTSTSGANTQRRCAARSRSAHGFIRRRCASGILRTRAACFR